jgi:hypothetical protein
VLAWNRFIHNHGCAPGRCRSSRLGGRGDRRRRPFGRRPPPDRARRARRLEDLANALHAPVLSIALRSWPPDFPEDIAVQRRAPYETRADTIMYRHVLAELAHARGWDVHCYDAKRVEAQATDLLGDRAEEVLQGPRATLGPPWAKDHHAALAATVVAGDGLTRRAAGTGLLSAATPASSATTRGGVAEGVLFFVQMTARWRDAVACASTRKGKRARPAPAGCSFAWKAIAEL